jgi:hypothetical protein
MRLQLAHWQLHRQKIRLVHAPRTNWEQHRRQQRRPQLLLLLPWQLQQYGSLSVQPHPGRLQELLLLGG